LLISIRAPREEGGAPIAGVKVGAVPALRERGMADDTIVYLSSAADVPLPPGVKTWVRFGEDAVEKTLGVSVGSENQVREQWSDLFYEEQVQVPDTADEEIEKTQRVFDEAVFGITGKGGRAFVRYSQSYQLWEDGGIDNIDLAKRMKAEWAALCVRMGGREDSWKGIWREAMDAVYHGIPRLLEGNCSFHLFRRTDASPVQKRALAAWGSLPALRGRVMVKNERAEIGAATWSMAHVEEQPLFFNPWYDKGTELLRAGGGSLPSRDAVSGRVIDRGPRRRGRRGGEGASGLARARHVSQRGGDADCGVEGGLPGIG